MNRCRVRACDERHNSHYCRLCKCKDSTHFSHKCPEGKTLYHGTALTCIKEISYQGLKPSTSGRLGPGIYFVKSFEVAKSISEFRGKQTGKGGAVFECRVNLGNTTSLGSATEGLKTWQHDYDSVKAIHPSWSKVNNNNKFEEHCLKNPKSCSVVKVVVTIGHVDKVGGTGEAVIRKTDKEWKKLKVNSPFTLPDNTPPNTDFRINIPPTIAVQNTTNTVCHDCITRCYSACSDCITGCCSGCGDCITGCCNDCIAIAECCECCECSSRRILFVILKLIFFLLTFVIQVGSTVVKTAECGYDNGAIISLIVFIVILSIARIIYTCIPPENHLYICTLRMVFLFEMPLMVSDAYVVKSCGMVDNWTLALHYSYIFHLCLALIMDSCFDFYDDEDRNDGMLLVKIILTLPITIMMYVPVYLKLGDKAYDFHLDVSKIGRHESGAILLEYIGTIGWGFWCVAFGFLGLALIIMPVRACFN